jgi:TRAP-type C4-dicarboxylate transport system permease small subunit
MNADIVVTSTLICVGLSAVYAFFRSVRTDSLLAILSEKFSRSRIIADTLVYAIALLLAVGAWKLTGAADTAIQPYVFGKIPFSVTSGATKILVLLIAAVFIGAMIHEEVESLIVRARKKAEKAGPHT